MNLNDIRKELDTIDTELLKLLAKRQSFMADVARYKRAHNMVIYQPEREAQILKAKKELAAQHGIDLEFIEKLFTLIFEHSRKIQEETKG